MAKRKQVDPIDNAIERAYYAQAQGRQISILNIPPLFKEVRSKMESGIALDVAMTEAIAKFCI